MAGTEKRYQLKEIWRLVKCAFLKAPDRYRSMRNASLLEGQSRGDLESARPAGTEDASGVTARLAERSRVPQITAEIGVVRKIEDIEDLSDQLKLRFLLDSDHSRQTQILRDEGVAVIEIRRQCNRRIGLVAWSEFASKGLVVLSYQILQLTHPDATSEAVPLHARQYKSVNALPGRINIADTWIQRRFTDHLRNE